MARPANHRIAFLVACGLTALVGCGGSDGGGTTPTDPDPTPTITSVSLTASNSSIEAGTTTTITAVARDASGGTVSAALTWASDAPEVATVDGSGVVRGVVPGSATITASAGSVQGSVQVEVRTRDIAALVESVRAAHGLPAMAGALVTRDGIVAMGVAGTRRAGGTAAVTLDDAWHIGSNLKAITAALGAVAVEAGAIDWTTTVESAFPELDGVLRDEYRSVTLRDLLANGGGIRNDPPGSAYAGATAQEQRDNLVAWALQAEPAVEVGSYHYSNPGFVTAGAMIERALGGTYEQLISSRVASPLGVDGVGWGPTTEAGGSDNPVGHSLQGGQWSPCEACDNPPGLSAAGRAHMPLPTWARIVRELLRADAGESSWLGASEARTLFTGHTPLPGSTDEYALGWIMTQRSWGGRTATHSGSNVTNHSVAWLGLDSGIALLAVTNAADLAGGSTSNALDALVVELLTLHQESN